jgi:hypothetical protein
MEEKCGFSIRVTTSSRDLFKEKCKKSGANIGDVFQAFMDAYIEDKVEIKMVPTKNGFKYELVGVK